MTNLLARLYNYENPQAPVLPTPDTLPPRSGSEADAVNLTPVKNWSHPFRDKRNQLLQLTHLANAAGGSYPLGSSGLLHGGVHFDGGTAGTLDQSSVHCLADGEVVAYRIDEQSPTTSYVIDKKPADRPFSRNFVLVRHRLQPPRIEGDPATPPSLILYSLYMHLQDGAIYKADPAIARPGFWSAGSSLQVRNDVNDPHPDHPGQRGLNVRDKAHKGKVTGWLPRGAEVKVSGAGEFRRLENILGPAHLLAADGTPKGYVAAELLRPIEGGQHRVACKMNELNVRAQANAMSEIIGKLPINTEVTVSGQSRFRKLERINQYVHFKSLQGGAPEPDQGDSIVVLAKPVAVKAGDLIGHIGLYHEGRAELAENKLHLEVFSGDDMDVFLYLSRLWAEQMPASSKTWLKLVKGTAVMTHQQGFSSQKPPTLKAASTPSDAQLLLPKSLLDALPAERKIVVPASGDRKACNWYRLEGLLHDASNTLLDGWVCEEIGVTPWVSPWSWEGYDTLYNYDSPRSMLTSFMRASDRLTDEQLARHSATADEVDKGPIKSRLFDIIDRNRDGKLSAGEIQGALNLPAHAQSISQLIVYYPSEWCHTPHKWDDLDELLGHSGSTPNLNWLAEKERIRQLSWWKEVASEVGLPGEGKVYHLHPVGLVGIFSNKTRLISVELLENVTGKSGRWFTGNAGGRHFAEDFRQTYPSIFEYDKYIFVEQVNEALERYGITTPYQQAHFVSQCFHESAAFDTTVEFGSGVQYDPGRHKDAVANGNTEVGDGPRYKGRGLIQLTWKNNYLSYSRYRSKDFVNAPNLVAEDMFNAIDASCWYWRHKGAVSKKHNAQGDINVLVNNEPNNVRLVTLAVNGGNNGLTERARVYEAVRRAWGLK